MARWTTFIFVSFASSIHRININKNNTFGKANKVPLSVFALSFSHELKPWNRMFGRWNNWQLFRGRVDDGNIAIAARIFGANPSTRPACQHNGRACARYTNLRKITGPLCRSAIYTLSFVFIPDAAIASPREEFHHLLVRFPFDTILHDTTRMHASWTSAFTSCYEERE